MEIFPSRSFLLGALLLLSWSFYWYCGSLSDAKSMWSWSWQTSLQVKVKPETLVTGTVELTLNKDIYSCICNTPAATLSLNSPAVKIRTEYMGNPYDIQRWSQRPQTFLKNICKSPKAECSLELRYLKQNQRKTNKASILISDRKVNTKKGGHQASLLSVINKC